jgi:hypothetical protein
MSRSKQKGTAFETLIARYLAGVTGQPVERRALKGATDDGDLHLPIPGGRLVLELKNHRALALADWISQAEIEAGNADKAFADVIGGAVIHKRRGCGQAGDQYVTLTLDTLLSLLHLQ